MPASKYSILPSSITSAFSHLPMSRSNTPSRTGLRTMSGN